MGKPKAPAAPDPYQTAGAQTESNQANAAYMAALNRMNTYGPTGSQTYNNEGNDPTTGAPVYSSHTTLSPEQQALYNSNTTNQLNQSGFAGNALDQARGAYQPINTNWDQQQQKSQDALYSRNTQYLDPQFAREGKGLDAKLAAQGVMPGSEAYKNAMDQFGETKNQAYEGARTDAISGATGQTGQNIQQSIALQNQPLNYYNSLMSGSQGSVPQFSQASPISTNPADVSGAINNNYQSQIGNYNSDVNSRNQTMGTAAQLAAMYFMFSDERLKDDYGVIGETPEGIPVHAYNYKGESEPRIGVMAQELEKKIPSAVVNHPSGFKMVDYSKVR
jgi:hypothetical protein